MERGLKDLLKTRVIIGDRYVEVICKWSTSLERIQTYSWAKTPRGIVCVATVRFCNWFCESVCNGINDPLITYFTNEIRFYLKQIQVRSQFRNDLGGAGRWHKILVCCAMSATGIIGPISFSDAINSERYSWQILGHFLKIQVARSGTTGSSSKTVHFGDRTTEHFLGTE